MESVACATTYERILECGSGSGDARVQVGVVRGIVPLELSPSTYAGVAP